MDRIKLRRDKEAVKERDLKIVTDYSNCVPIKEIRETYGFKSLTTIYKAIERINRTLEKEQL